MIITRSSHSAVAAEGLSRVEEVCYLRYHGSDRVYIRPTDCICAQESCYDDFDFSSFLFLPPSIVTANVVGSRSRHCKSIRGDAVECWAMYCAVSGELQQIRAGSRDTMDG